MLFSAVVCTAVTAFLPVLGSVCRPFAQSRVHDVNKYSGETTGRYVVKFKSATAKFNTLATLTANVDTMITHDWDIIPGIAGYFDAVTLDVFRRSPDVEYIHEDGIARTTMLLPNQFAMGSENIETIETDAPWGLGRLTSPLSLSGQSNRALSFHYSYLPSAGYGVDIYIVDTGVMVDHEEFGGRAKWGATFGNYSDADGNGHGTHVAGTAAGNQFGVAKRANIIAVKVLSDGGWGSWADVISGLNWVGAQAALTKRPSVASLSLGGSGFIPVDDAANALTARGVHLVVAAGNNAMDASQFSPSRAVGAIAVGATNINDARAWFSNFGALVAVHAPGVDVISSWICSNTATNKISGTSMATPHVSGLVAYLIARDGNVPPPVMKKKIQDLAVRDVITDLPDETANLLAHP